MNKISTLFITIPLSLSSLCQGQETLIHHTDFTLSYNCEHGTADWVSWTLTKSHVQMRDACTEPVEVSRSSTFYTDPLVPYAYRVMPSDHTNSGYDRGHLCPAADMAYSQASMHDCFYMSNMCPQVPTLNRVSWKALETACRKWVMTEDTLYIVAGPVYINPPFQAIGQSHKVCANSGINVPPVSVCNVPLVAQSNVPHQKWLR